MENYVQCIGWLGRTTHVRIFRVLTFLAILYLMVVGNRYFLPPAESFVSSDTKFEVKRNGDAFDTFYANIYNQIHEPKNMAETVAEFVISFSKSDPNRSMMLDIGAGTGEQMAYIQSRGYQIYGVDASPDMVEYALEQHPNLKLKVGNVEQSMLYEKGTFTHILCTGVDSVLYQLHNKQTFFHNCYHWLLPHGYLILLLVDRNEFVPVPSSGKKAMMDYPQISLPRITDAEISFKNFQYKSSFDFSKKEEVVVTETFTDQKTRQVRKNEQTLYIEDVDDILLMARKCGFIVQGQTNLIEKGDEHQYIYLLERPN